MLEVSDGIWGQGQVDAVTLVGCVTAAITHWSGDPTLRDHAKCVASAPSGQRVFREDSSGTLPDTWREV